MATVAAVMGQLPRRAQLGPFRYRITMDPDEWTASGVDMDHHYGYTDHRRGVIIIHHETTDDMRRVVLLHELMHAAAFAAGCRFQTKQTEEKWVGMTAPMLLDGLLKSFELRQYLFRENVT